MSDNNKVNSFINQNRFEEIIEQILSDNKLNSQEKLILVVLFNYAQEIFPSFAEIAKKTSLTTKEIKQNLNKLIDHNWCKKDILKSRNKETYHYLRLPFKEEINSNLYNQPGSKIASNWSNIFGTDQLTPTYLNKFTSFIKDGMEEEVIIEVMKISAEKAEGNPVNYALKVLNNYLKRGILSSEDFAEERSEQEKYEEQIQKDNRAKKKRKKLHDFEELQKRGWNE